MCVPEKNQLWELSQDYFLRLFPIPDPPNVTVCLGAGLFCLMHKQDGDGMRTQPPRETQSISGGTKQTVARTKEEVGREAEGDGSFQSL